MRGREMKEGNGRGEVRGEGLEGRGKEWESMEKGREGGSEGKGMGR